jgi:hypothetical protein
MPRFAAGVKTGAGSTILPLISLFSSAVAQPNIREIGLFNTTTTAVDVKLCRLSSGPGTLGAGLAETPIDNPVAVAGCQAFTTYTAGTIAQTDAGYRASIGAAIGAGVIWSFGGEGLEILPAAGTVNGIGVVIENGTGQALQAYLVWDE